MNIIFLIGVLMGSVFVLIIQLMIICSVLLLGLINLEYKLIFEVLAILVGVFLLGTHIKAIFSLNAQAVDVAKNNNIKSPLWSGFIWRISNETTFFIKRFKK